MRREEGPYPEDIFTQVLTDYVYGEIDLTMKEIIHCIDGIHTFKSPIELLHHVEKLKQERREKMK